MRQELEQYRTEPSPIWEGISFYGGGYDVMEAVTKWGWKATYSWGKDHGYNLGSWPLVIIFRRDGEPNRYYVVEYVEGDVAQYLCPTREIRDEIIDNLAFFHWKSEEESWVEGIDSVEQLPDGLRGPYRARELSSE